MKLRTLAVILLFTITVLLIKMFYVRKISVPDQIEFMKSKDAKEAINFLGERWSSSEIKVIFLIEITIQDVKRLVFDSNISLEHMPEKLGTLMGLLDKDVFSSAVVFIDSSNGTIVPKEIIARKNNLLLINEVIPDDLIEKTALQRIYLKNGLLVDWMRRDGIFGISVSLTDGNYYLFPAMEDKEISRLEIKLWPPRGVDYSLLWNHFEPWETV